jgi:hypothetical protein
MIRTLATGTGQSDSYVDGDLATEMIRTVATGTMSSVIAMLMETLQLFGLSESSDLL